MKDLFTVTEAAKVLNRSERTIRRLCNNGTLDAIQISERAYDVINRWRNRDYGIMPGLIRNGRKRYWLIRLTPWALAVNTTGKCDLSCRREEMCGVCGTCICRWDES